MENLRYLLAAIAALTLIMSVVSSVNPSYFAGLSAFADHDEEEEDDDSGSGSNDDEEESEDDDDDKKGKSNKEDEQEFVKSLGNHSKATLEIEDDDAELGVEIQDGDLEDGQHDVVFECASPTTKAEFPDALDVEDGEGEFEADLSLSMGTYSGCEVDAGGLSAVFPSFNVTARGEDDEEEQEHEVEEKRKEKKERIVTTVNGTTIHEKHRSKNAASPGEFEPGWNYMLEAAGNATARSGNETSDATVDVNMAVWKSTRSIILLDVIDGTVQAGNQTYTVVLGYALYTIHHDIFRVGALAIGDDGEIYKLKLRGSAGDDAEFPMESGSVDLTFEGSSGPSNRLGDWELTLEGTVKAG